MRKFFYQIAYDSHNIASTMRIYSRQIDRARCIAILFHSAGLNRRDGPG